MEYKKDIQQKEEISTGSVSNGHDTAHIYQGIQDDVVHYEVFEKVAKDRIEKLVTALYMVTDCMDAGDPLKSQMRRLGVDMLSDMTRLSHMTPGEKHVVLSGFEDDVSELSAYLSVAASVGQISSMNHAILKREFLKLQADCIAQKGKVFLSKKEMSTLSVGTIAEMFTEQSPAIESVKDTLAIKDIVQAPAQSVFYERKNSLPESFIKDPLVLTKKTLDKSAMTQKNLSRALDVGLKVERKNKILKLIKEKKEVTIKDISTVISGCSEKTVQRELSSLVAEGVLTKTGEKRWSKYSLKTL